MKLYKKLNKIQKPDDLLMIPIPKLNPENWVEMELNNVYGYISWLKNRISQLENVVDSNPIRKKRISKKVTK